MSRTRQGIFEEKLTGSLPDLRGWLSETLAEMSVYERYYAARHRDKTLALLSGDGEGMEKLQAMGAFIKGQPRRQNASPS